MARLLLWQAATRLALAVLRASLTATIRLQTRGLPLAPIPTGMSMGSAVYYPTTNKIYVFGGQEADSGVVYNLTQIL